MTNLYIEKCDLISSKYYDWIERHFFRLLLLLRDVQGSLTENNILMPGLGIRKNNIIVKVLQRIYQIGFVSADNFHSLHLKLNCYSFYKDLLVCHPLERKRAKKNSFVISFVLNYYYIYVTIK